MAEITEQLLQQIGEQFRQLRLAHNISQDELATSSGVGVSTLKRLEKGKGCNLAAFVQLMVALDYGTEIRDQLARLVREASGGVSSQARPRRRASSPRQQDT